MSQRYFYKISYRALDERFFRQPCKMSSRFANPTFLMRLQGILQGCFQGIFYHCFENYLAKISKNCFCEMSYIRLHEMSLRQLCKISSRLANPTFFRRLKDILPGCLECLHLHFFFPAWKYLRFNLSFPTGNFESYFGEILETKNVPIILSITE